MIRTLYYYLGRELAKVTILATVAFTLVMTVFAIIEPLRKQGLAGEQVLPLIGYTLPVMLSLTLPIAALFAATIVYGRFAQENEMMACRASGIATLSLLKPALVLGAVVTIASLFLSNYVSPQMAASAETSIKNNIRGIVYRQLRLRSYVRERGYIVHADFVDAEHDELGGVVVADTTQPDDVRLMTAKAAFVRFLNYFGEWYISVGLVNPSATTLRYAQKAGKGQPAQDLVGYSIYRETSQPLVFRLPNPTRERASWYSWDQLIGIQSDPTRNMEIRRELDIIRQRISHDKLANEVASAVNQGRAYKELHSEDQVYSITAARATVSDSGAALLYAEATGGHSSKRVEVAIGAYGRVQQVLSADLGRVEAHVSPQFNNSVVSITLEGNVTDRSVSTNMQSMRRGEWKVGQLKIPASIQAVADGIKLEDIYTRAEGFTANHSIKNSIRELTTRKVGRLIGCIKGEMHSRVAYGASCFLLVALGAALGLIYRGGQVLSAFAISVIPAAIVIILVIMGKQMTENIKIPLNVGLASIWSGILLMAAADVIIYYRLMRK